MSNSHPIRCNTFGNRGWDCLCGVVENGEVILAALGAISIIGAIVLLWVGSLISPNALTWLDFAGYSFCAVSLLSFGSLAVISKCRDRCISDTPRTRDNLVNNEPAYSINRVGDRRGLIKIKIEKTELRQRPVEHLQAFAAIVEDHIRSRDSASMHVRFQGQQAVDAGGVTREYLDDLISGLISKRNLFKILDNTSLAVPNPDPQTDLKVFENLGKVMMYCYPSNPIGFHIDPSVFAVAFAYTTNEINSNLAPLSLERKFELYRILLAAQQDEANQKKMGLLQSQDWTNEQFAEVVEILKLEHALPQEVIVTPAELMGKDILKSNIWAIGKEKRFKKMFRTRQKEFIEALKRIGEKINPPERAKELLDILKKGLWREPEFIEAAHIVFSQAQDVDIQQVFKGGMPADEEMWETVEVKTINPIFPRQYEQRVREALAQLEMLDTREEVVEPIQKLLAVKAWDDGKWKEAVEIIFEQVNLRVANKSSFLPRLKIALQGFLEAYLDPQLRGIQAIAKGMKSICRKGGDYDQNTHDIHWDQNIRTLNLDQFNQALQGNLDREHIVAQIRDNTGSDSIAQKVAWLKEWIQDQKTTKKEIMELLKFITGSSCLPPGARITIAIGLGGPYPRTHTCSNTIDITPEYVRQTETQQGDDTKEHFIEALKYAFKYSGGRMDAL